MWVGWAASQIGKDGHQVVERNLGPPRHRRGGAPRGRRCSKLALVERKNQRSAMGRTGHRARRSPAGCEEGETTMSDGLQVIHAVARASQQDVLFLCDDEWSLATLDTRGLP